MNNLTQTQQNAKQAYLDRQANQMLATYQKANKGERNAVIQQIDSFLEIVSPEAKIFWLKFRYKLERLNEKSLRKKTGNQSGCPFLLEFIEMLANFFLCPYLCLPPACKTLHGVTYHLHK